MLAFSIPDPPYPITRRVTQAPPGQTTLIDIFFIGTLPLKLCTIVKSYHLFLVCLLAICRVARP